ncbi:unnamed protein product [Mytilus coruscus]|uniref:CCHC-type domain-containing protein n=1 Tax=Mytilus coruscus TaxID=42192 RepID=A0A6J8EQR3_MYTCO|nr:unnamed protein product [Mytilus coruscus]
MGEVYGYRKAELQVAAASKHPKSNDKHTSDFAALQSQIDTYTKMVQDLTLTSPKKNAHQNRRTDRFSYNRQQITDPSHASSNLCFSCNSSDHIKRYCNLNGQGIISSDVKCQLCDQIGHSAASCMKLSENRTIPGVPGTAHREDGDIRCQAA